MATAAFPPTPRVARALVASSIFGLLVVFAFLFFGADGKTEGMTIPSGCDELDLAVLPMQNLTGDTAENYLSKAISSEIWSRLHSYQALKLVPMRSSFSFLNDNANLTQISEEVDARYIVDGSFSHSGSSVRLLVQLVDSATDENVWASGYVLGQDTEGMFAAYSEIASEIAQALNAATGRRTEAPPTEHLAAWQLIQRAWYRLIESGDINDVVPLIDRAIEIDPRYSRARASKALALAGLAELSGLPAKEQLREAKELAEQAIKFNSNDPIAMSQAYSALGQVYQRLDLDFPRAYEAFLRSQQYDLFMSADPFSDLLIHAGRYDEGLAWALRHEAAFPAEGSTRVQTARFLVRLGRAEDATRKIEEALRLSPGHQWVETVALELFVLDLDDRDRSLELLNGGHVHSTVAEYLGAELTRRSGDPSAMQRLLDAWIERRREEYVPFHPWLISNGLYRVGDYERHFRWFATRVDERSHVSWFNDALNYRWPDYWANLREWSLSDPSKTKERAVLLDEHRALVDRIREKMTLHELTPKSFGLGGGPGRCS
jgi:TolB-like protein